MKAKLKTPIETILGETEMESEMESQLEPQLQSQIPPELMLESLFNSSSNVSLTSDEIKDRAREGLSFLIPKALRKISRALDSTDTTLSLSAAKDILDRSGLVKPQQIQFDTSSLPQATVLSALIGAAKIFSLPMEEGEVRRTMLELNPEENLRVASERTLPSGASEALLSATSGEDKTPSSPEREALPPTKPQVEASSSRKAPSQGKGKLKHKVKSEVKSKSNSQFPTSNLPPELLSSLGGSK